MAATINLIDETPILIFPFRILFVFFQVEMNPLWKQKKLREFCKEKGIHIIAYSPLGASNTNWGDNRILGCDVLEEIAKAKGKTIAQVGFT